MPDTAPWTALNIIGPRRSGKTWTAAAAVNDEVALNRAHSILAIHGAGRAAGRALLKVLRIAGGIGPHTCNETQATALWASGATVMVGSFDDLDRCRGLGFDLLWVDEPQLASAFVRVSGQREVTVESRGRGLFVPRAIISGPSHVEGHEGVAIRYLLPRVTAA